MTAALAVPSALLDLREGPDGAFTATIPERLCVGVPGATFLFGGSAFATGIAAMERLTGLPVIVASAQFVDKARPGEEAVFAPVLSAAGRALAQARVAASATGRDFARMQGAFGRRSEPTVHPGEPMPQVPPPADCPQRSVARLLSSNVNAVLDFRLAAGQLPDRADWQGPGGQDLACWVALRSGEPVTRLVLPVIADCAAISLPGALGRPASGTSLDNVIRIVADADCPIVLSVTRVEAVRDGIAHLGTRIYAPDGTLLAIAQQSMILRVRPPA